MSKKTKSSLEYGILKELKKQTSILEKMLKGVKEWKEIDKLHHKEELETKALVRLAIMGILDQAKPEDYTKLGLKPPE